MSLPHPEPSRLILRESRREAEPSPENPRTAASRPQGTGLTAASRQLPHGSSIAHREVRLPGGGPTCTGVHACRWAGSRTPAPAPSPGSPPGAEGSSGPVTWCQLPRLAWSLHSRKWKRPPVGSGVTQLPPLFLHRAHPPGQSDGPRRKEVGTTSPLRARSGQLS